MGFEAVRIVSGKTPRNECFSVKVYLLKGLPEQGYRFMFGFISRTEVSEAQCLYAKTRAFSLMPGF